MRWDISKVGSMHLVPTRSHVHPPELELFLVIEVQRFVENDYKLASVTCKMV